VDNDTLQLFGTAGCHLCDEAEAQLRALAAAGLSISWTTVDIADDDQLFKRYGWLIPVLRRADGAELRWPFDPAMLAEFLRAGAHAPAAQP
jgi:hypothetical protein